jgi:N,N-dimethylformamidase
MLKILGYADEISRRPGERLKVMVSCPGTSRFRADLRRIIQGDVNPEGPGYRDVAVNCDLGGPFAGRVQPIHTGSYVEVASPGPASALGSFTIGVMVSPTLPGKGSQTVLCHRDPHSGAGFSLGLDECGRARLEIGNGAGDATAVLSP